MLGFKDSRTSVLKVGHPLLYPEFNFCAFDPMAKNTDSGIMVVCCELSVDSDRLSSDSDEEGYLLGNIYSYRPDNIYNDEVTYLAT